MCPDKKLAWFDDEQAVTAEMLVRQRWSDTYEKFSQAEELSQPSSSHTEVRYFLKLFVQPLKWNTGAFEVAFSSAEPAPTFTGT